MQELSPKVLARAQRMEEKHASRRNQIVSAAKAVFATAGLSGATMRAIAAEAGMTTGAIYPHFATKDDLYGQVLSNTLSDLCQFVATQLENAVTGQKGQAALQAFFEFYANRPDDLALGLYLYDGIGRSGLTPELDVRLNRQLRDTFTLISDGFVSDGVGDAEVATANGVSHAVGLLVMERTGRLKLFGQTASTLFQTKTL